MLVKEGQGALTDHAAHGLENQVARVGHPAADDNRIRIDDPNDAAQRGTQFDADVIPQPRGNLVATIGRSRQVDGSTLVRAFFLASRAIVLHGPSRDLGVAYV